VLHGRETELLGCGRGRKKHGKKEKHAGQHARSRVLLREEMIQSDTPWQLVETGASRKLRDDPDDETGQEPGDQQYEHGRQDVRQRHEKFLQLGGRGTANGIDVQCLQRGGKAGSKTTMNTSVPRLRARLRRDSIPIFTAAWSTPNAVARFRVRARRIEAMIQPTTAMTRPAKMRGTAASKPLAISCTGAMAPSIRRAPRMAGRKNSITSQKKTLARAFPAPYSCIAMGRYFVLV